jgi:sec-independent protein translocase protein TatA
MDKFLAFGIGAGQEWLIILVVILILFGGTKIPQLMRGVGQGVGELKKGLEEGKRNFEEAAKPDEPK